MIVYVDRVWDISGSLSLFFYCSRRLSPFGLTAKIHPKVKHEEKGERMAMYIFRAVAVSMILSTSQIQQQPLERFYPSVH